MESPRSFSDVLIETAKKNETEHGGKQVEIKSLQFTGNTIFSNEELLDLCGPVAGHSYDLADLRAIAERVSTYYHDQGYPFARAFLPSQQISDGVLGITILEGRYGKVQALGEADVAADAQGYLNTIQTGDVIEGSTLERATLILSDQKGIKAAPIIRPGQDVGTGDLNVQVSLKRTVKGDIGVDNYGNRYTGEYRGHANIEIESPFFIGDQILLNNILTDEEMWLGSIGYNLPLANNGLRGQISYTQTQYQLGKQFDSLDATGYAKVFSTGLSYPIVRSQKANLTLGGLYQHKDLLDEQGSTGTRNTKYSDSAPVTLQFDRRDSLGGGAITYGAVSWSYGNINLDSDLLSTDRTTARTQGGYNRFNLDVARLQTLPESLSLFARFSGQMSDKNLDSSEKFGLGGSNGVRAYPVGESYGDEGWLSQVEFRYTYDAVTPFAFFDAGGVKTNKTPWDTAANTRNLAGAGLGARVAYEGFSVDAALAWRVDGGKPVSDTQDRIPRVWVAASYKF